MKMLVTGAAGAVGSYAERVFGDKYDLILVDKDELDITEPVDCRWIQDLNPDVVLHLAAATDVDECERNVDLAWRVNAQGTGNVVQNSLSSKLVYVSTAGVFRGDKLEPYVESDRPAPANRYGWSKLCGERIVQADHPDWLIVRSGWMFGGGRDLDKKFVGKILNQIDAGHETIYAVDDKFGSPTYALDLLYVIDNLLYGDERGLFHGSNDGVATRYEVAQAIVDLTGAKVNVKPTSSETFNLDAPRAQSEAMASIRRDPSRPWEDALSEYLS